MWYNLSSICLFYFGYIGSILVINFFVSVFDENIFLIIFFVSVFDENMQVSGRSFRTEDGTNNKWRAEIRSLRSAQEEEAPSAAVKAEGAATRRRRRNKKHIRHRTAKQIFLRGDNVVLVSKLLPDQSWCLMLFCMLQCTVSVYC